ncbi:FG-GAP repeat domain-containing protein [Streptomyces sp. NPDC059866]|uniref:FG-GAP repeat domain-containing protein n=1 Tax=Streptomyces sp. NPDC059866 TaxID=3346978 RepID=UPI003667D264
MSGITRRTVVVALALLAATTSAITLQRAHGEPPGAVSVRRDFNGDGYEDLAVAAPSGTVNGRVEAGYVAVLYGAADGLAAHGRKVYSQASPGVPGSPEKRDKFGYGLDAADLDGDGFTDLLVTATGERWQYGGSEREAGRTVLWGGSGGFAAGTVLPAIGSSSYQNGEIATGDFDGDGHQDLVRSGRVELGPFTRDGSPALVQDAGLVDGANESVSELAAGDVDGDGITDLVERVIEHGDNDEETSRLCLRYLRGSQDGLLPYTVLKDAQGRLAEANGAALALGDLNGDGRADLVNGFDRLTISYGTPHGPDASAPVVIDQDTPGVPGTQEAGDSFGGELAVGDVDGDGYGDILAGNASEGVGTVTPTGTIAVVPGGPHGPTGAGTQVFSQNSAGVPGVAERADAFGSALDLVDGNGDGRAEPVVGAYGENSGDGAVWVFRATSAGATPTGSFAFGARTLGTVVDGGWLGHTLPH